jgi:hypothetical protein
MLTTLLLAGVISAQSAAPPSGDFRAPRVDLQTPARQPPAEIDRAWNELERQMRAVKSRLVHPDARPGEGRPICTIRLVPADPAIDRDMLKPLPDDGSRYRIRVLPAPCDAGPR